MNINEARFMTSFGLMSQLPPSEYPEIVFAGRSNVGKSSLINKLFSRRLARVSNVPGKTATINFYACGDVRFVDLPGYGYAKTSKTEKNRLSGLIGGYFESGRDILLTLLLIDVRHLPSKDDVNMVNYLIDSECPFMILFTKADKLSRAQLEARMEDFAAAIPCFSDIKYILTSSETGLGIDKLRELVKGLL